MILCIVCTEGLAFDKKSNTAHTVKQILTTKFIPMRIRFLGIPAWTSSVIMDPKVEHMESMDSRCSGESGEILRRSNQTVDGAPLIGV